MSRVAAEGHVGEGDRGIADGAFAIHAAAILLGCVPAEEHVGQRQVFFDEQGVHPAPAYAGCIADEDRIRQSHADAENARHSPTLCGGGVVDELHLIEPGVGCVVIHSAAGCAAIALKEDVCQCRSPASVVEPSSVIAAGSQGGIVHKTHIREGSFAKIMVHSTAASLCKIAAKFTVHHRQRAGVAPNAAAESAGSVAHEGRACKLDGAAVIVDSTAAVACIIFPELHQEHGERVCAAKNSAAVRGCIADEAYVDERGAAGILVVHTAAIARLRIIVAKNNIG